MSIWAACGLTVAIETAFLAVCGYRTAAFLAVCVCANAATNLALNLSLAPLSSLADITFFIYPLEALVVAAEYCVFASVTRRSARLFLLTLLANCLSYCAGLMLNGHV